MGFRFTVDFSDTLKMRRLLEQLSQGGIKKAQSRTLDKSSSPRGKLSLIRDAAEVVATGTGLKKKRALTGFKRTKRPNINNLRAVIRASAATIPVVLYSPRTKKQGNTRAVRADISVKKGQGVELLTKAFQPIGKRGKKQILRRVKKGGKSVGRYPLKPAHGPSMARHARTVHKDNLNTYARKTGRLLQTELAIEIQKERRRHAI